MGSFWQAYATLKALKSIFPKQQVEIINYHRKFIQSEVKYNNFIQIRKRHLHPLFLLRDILGRKSYRNCQKKYLGLNTNKGFFCDKLKPSVEFINQQSYDFIFVGSDTVLSFYEHNYQKTKFPIFWIPKEIKGKKFLLSASMGTKPPNLEKCSTYHKNKLKESLKGFNRLGVRDDLTYSTILKITNDVNDKLYIIPDPTFSIDINTAPAKKYLIKKGLDLSKPIVGIDIPLNVPGVKEYTNKMIQKGVQFITWRNRPPISFWGCSDIDPIVWSGMFKFFSLTITNRFHATIFCLKNLAPVLAIDCKPGRYLENGWSKTSSLLEGFDMKETHHKNIADLKKEGDLEIAAELALKKFNKVEVSSKLKFLNNEFKNYLKAISQTIDTNS